MKRFFRLTILLTLTALVLFTGSGFTLSKMLCVGSGKVKYSLTEQDDCCKGEKETATLESKCCDVSNQLIKIDSFKLDKSFNLVSICLFPTKLFCSPEPLFVKSFTRFTFNDSSPPPFGVKLLVLISSFLI
jgi:hypothetical protein